ncbi:MAG TPA: PQQ-binding-like beta-propeller repeat protein [Acidimicrobiales bacterium]
MRCRPVAKAALALVIVGVAAAACTTGGESARNLANNDTTVAASSTSTAAAEGATTAVPSTTLPAVVGVAPGTTAPLDPPSAGWVDPRSFAKPWAGKTVGLLTFKGNPTRSWQGLGPLPAKPKVQWRFPATGSMCAQSSSLGETKVWCGMGWTGQPNVLERSDGSTWVLFGGYDDAYHVLDASTGTAVKPRLPTGDLPKGTGTLDPDGFPLWYMGARDGKLRVMALDRDELTVLYEFTAKSVKPTLWNDDWDAAPLALDDYLFAGGENSRWHIFKLNRGYGPDGKVTVTPQLVFHAAGWDDQLLKDIGDRNVGIENSLAIRGNTVWFANSGGLVQGWDISGLRQGRMPTRTFRFWMGDDVDASIIPDDKGFLWVGSQFQRKTAQGTKVGQLVKLDPSKPADPVVWSIKDQTQFAFQSAAGVWGTPVVLDDVVIANTAGGRLMGLDRATGAELWTLRLAPATINSPVVVDGVLVMGDCRGVLHGYDVRNPRVVPTELWQVELGGCIESTPAVWKGRIYVGTRGGALWALG